jgi:hypothetical protein
MKVLLNHSKAKNLHQKYPDSVGVLFSPERTRYYSDVPFAIDNGAYGAWLKGQDFNQEKFINVCQKFAELNPLFVVCPDKVNDRAETLNLWDKWHSFLLDLKLPAAFVFTNGMTIDDIPDNADYVFVGGDNQFKEWAITNTAKISKPVHVGRVNYHSRLWKCHNYGVASCDGTGWFRGDHKQELILMDYLDISSGKTSKETSSLFFTGLYCR